ncbi:MAG: 1-aminocyclopropane-1-carboxylate deaminase/D-cysteine desulfhydrase [Flavobacteriaceae bacterium]|nr:1-aminocyclopropane-1-carboxylate deaminase/D-cysteine desulfhydrase [Flavobacteriaceae bacterium]
MDFKLHSENEKVNFSLFKNIDVYIKREDKLHEHISGNKYRKLKYNLIKAKEEHQETLLTFGGAYSNHIAATAAAGEAFGFQTIGVIRGDELVDKIDENPTLHFAAECGMHFKFVSREVYRKKATGQFLESLKKEFGDVCILPEGGTNALAIKGCEEILQPDDAVFDYISVAVGTGGTISGLINSAMKHQKILGFPALKGDFLEEEIYKLTGKRENLQMVHDYHFGGYGKINTALVAFINQFREETNIPLDPVYTGKMMYGLAAMSRNGFFSPGTKILAIHTGGLQGIKGMNIHLKRKGYPLIDIE